MNKFIKVLIWVACYAVLAIVFVLLKFAGIILGFIPVAVMFLAATVVAIFLTRDR